MSTPKRVWDFEKLLAAVKHRMNDTSVSQAKRDEALSDYTLLIKWKLLYNSGDIIGEALTKYDPRMKELDEMFGRK
jgi:hypothetical protein